MTKPFIFYLTISFNRQLTSSSFRLVHSVQTGSRVRLRCPAPSPWLLCVWESPLGWRTCRLKAGLKRHLIHLKAFEPAFAQAFKRIKKNQIDLFIEKGNPEELCSATNPRVTIDPRPDTQPGCDLDLEVGVGDHGTWTCLMALTQTRDVHTVVTRLALSVIVTPVLR